MSRRLKEYQRFLGKFGHAAELSPGRFRKRHPLDCGRARCHLCHGEKLMDRLTPAQIRANEAFAQSVKDIA